MRLEKHIKKRLRNYFATTCDCSRHFQRNFDNNYSIIAWFHSKCKSEYKRSETCPPEIEVWQSNQLKATLHIPSSAREFDEILKHYGIMDEDLGVGDTF